MAKYRHGEAFCLMEYETEDGNEREIIWNSRDGVTPFCIRSRTGKQMRHTNWQNDMCVPDYEPAPGSRMFVDATRELVTPKLRKYVDDIWDDKKYPASKMFESKQEAFDKLLPDWLGESHGGGAPWLVEVKG